MLNTVEKFTLQRMNDLCLCLVFISKKISGKGTKKALYGKINRRDSCFFCSFVVKIGGYAKGIC